MKQKDVVRQLTLEEKCALANSWSVETAQRMGAVVGADAAARDVQVLLGPGLNTKRSPLCGRSFEYYSEDPYLAGKLPAFIIRRLPLRFTYDNNYFTDRFQGIPVGGYTPMIEKLLEGVEVRLNTDFSAVRNANLADKTVYTGPMDEYFGYCCGELGYRSPSFEIEDLTDTDNYQGNLW